MTRSISRALRTNALTLALLLSAGLAGCAADAYDPEPRSSRDRSSAADLPGDGPLDPASDCRRMCDRVYHGCAGSVSGSDIYGEDPAVCLELCEAGAIDDELDCVLTTSCAAIPRICFDAGE